MRSAIRTAAAVWALLWWSAAAGAVEGDRLDYLDEPLDPYYVHQQFPALTTPQWVGEEGVEAVVVLAIDDMRDSAKYEAYLRPILDRLKQIDGRAAVSIMTCRADPADPQLQSWLKEGVSLEVHTYDHPCPCLQGGDFQKARGTYERCVDLLSTVPGCRPVAFRMPCCDSLNTPSPRFWTEVFNRVSPAGHFLTIDSSVFQIFTDADPQVRALLGERRFRRYLPFPSFVNTIENYPYPYVIGRLCWQFPCIVPSDWEAQHVQQPNNPRTVEDLQLALDITVAKQGVFNLVFHPHGWIRNDQVVQLIDHAVSRHGGKVKFLTFREAQQRIDRHLLAGQPLRNASGLDNGVRLLDLNEDGHLDVVTGNSTVRRTRIWDPQTKVWQESEFPARIVLGDETAEHRDAGARFGLDDRGQVLLLVRNDQTQGAWRWTAAGWAAAPERLKGLRLEGRPVKTASRGIDRGVRLRDLNGDGASELLAGSPQIRAAWQWRGGQWQPADAELPDSLLFVDSQGRDAGLRLADINGDGAEDLLFSDDVRCSLHLMDVDDRGRMTGRGWTRQVFAMRRPADGEIPRIVSAAANNGAWLNAQHLWVQNEHTSRLPDHVDRRSFQVLLELGQPPDDDNAQLPGSRDPEQSLAAMRVRPGLRLELVAAEPLVADPVAFDWGPDGRLWVVEMGDYPNGVDGQGRAGGRVRVLSDRDGDGRYDHSQLFQDELPFPNGVKVWRRGVLVTAAPHVLYLEDTDGDGRADVRKVLYEGFVEGNQQHRVNGLRWGLDNWLHLANGDSGGRVRSVKRDTSINIRGRDLKIRPDQGDLDTTSGQTQFGTCRDDWGNWFGGNNSNPMWHYVLRDEDLRRNPHVAPPQLRRQVPRQAGAARVYPASRTLERFNDFEKANRFTSACSPIVYRDSWLGAEFQGNTFVCEPVHNLVHREVMRREASSFVSQRAADEQESEFLVSEDNWFRPTKIRTGPDGCLWVADMYRLVIEHPQWIPEDWQRRLDLRAGHKLGRIYRVIPAAQPPRPLPRLDRMTPLQLVDALDHPNGWQRDMAHQMLLWEPLGDAQREVVGKLRSLLAAGRPEARVQALSVLSGLEAVQPGDVLPLLRHENPGVRQFAARTAGGLLAASAEPLEELEKQLSQLAADSDGLVQVSAAAALGGGWTASSKQALAALLSVDDEFVAAAAMSSLHQANIEGVLAEFLQRSEQSEAGSRRLPQLLAVAAKLDRPQAADKIVSQLADAVAAGKSAADFDRLAQVLTGLGRRSASPALQLAGRQARQAAADTEQSLEQRMSAVGLLGRGLGRPQEEAAALSSLLRPQTPAPLQLRAVESLGRLPAAVGGPLLLDSWRGHSPALRLRILEQLTATAKGRELLLEAVAAGDISPRQIDARTRQLLLADADPQAAAAWRELEPAPQDAQEREKTFRRILSLPGDFGRGRQLFAKHCSTCHRLEETGTAVGPDLTALTDNSSRALLTAVLDPNRAWEAKYTDYLAADQSGRRYSGILESETATSITLLAPEGKRHVLLRSELERLASMGRSLMPEGIQRDMSPQDLADVIAFVRSAGPPPKQFAGNQPSPIEADPDGTLYLPAESCRIYGPKVVFEPRYGNLGWWQSEADRAVWDIRVPGSGGTYDVQLDFACARECAGNAYQLRVGDHVIRGDVPSTGTWDEYRRRQIGEFDLPSGPLELTFRSDGPIRSALIDLRGIRLEPKDK